jgi:adenine-specific DNA-methyltransferase
MSQTTTTATETPLSPAAQPSETGGFQITSTELVWPGKYNEDGTRKGVPRVSLPFQVIETINESRATREAEKHQGKTLFDFYQGKEGETFEAGWKNKLIWGDNLLVMSSLLEKFAGQVDLIYIDPPFAIGADFSFSAQIGEADDEIKKQQSVIEEKAYRDTWGRGIESYLEMLSTRLSLMRDLLTPNGSVYVHIGPNINHLVRTLLQEVFGAANFQREIVWQRVTARSHGNYYPATHDAILFAIKGGEPTWNQQFTPVRQELIESHYNNIEEKTGRRYTLDNCLNQNKDRPNLRYDFNGHIRTWRWTKEKMQEYLKSGRIVITSSGMPRYKRYLDESPGVPLQSVWTDIKPVNSQADEDTGYDTQKPETLLERIISSS